MKTTPHWLVKTKGPWNSLIRRLDYHLIGSTLSGDLPSRLGHPCPTQTSRRSMSNLQNPRLDSDNEPLNRMDPRTVRSRSDLRKGHPKCLDLLWEHSWTWTRGCRVNLPVRLPPGVGTKGIPLLPKCYRRRTVPEETDGTFVSTRNFEWSLVPRIRQKG